MKITVTEDGKIIKEYLLDNGFSTSQIRTLKRAEKGITVNGEPSTVGRLLKNGDIRTEHGRYQPDARRACGYSARHSL